MKSFIITLFFPFCCFAQQPKPLSIGDTLPAQQWKEIIKAEHSPLSLGEGSEVRSLVILDFFATWCSSCYKKFPHLDSLQNQFRDSLILILVNTVSAREDSATIAAFFSKRKKSNGLPYNFSLILADSVFNKLFPHILVPHYIWIYNDRFIAATGAEWITEANIRKILSGIPVKWEIKTDSLQFEKRKHLLNKQNQP